MLSDKLRPVIEPATAAIGRVLGRARLTPNALTTAGLLASLWCAWLIANGDLRLGGLVLIPAAIIDVLDGALARATGRVSAWGAYYDSVCDRISDGALIAGVVWYARLPEGTGAEPGGARLMIAALATLVVSSLVPYARAKAEAAGLVVASGPGERAERVIILIVGLIVGRGPLELSLWLILALSAWTFVARAVAVRAQTRT